MTPCGAEPGPSDVVPMAPLAGSSQPSSPVAWAVNQMPPSAAGATSWGCEPAGTAYSRKVIATDGVGVGTAETRSVRLSLSRSVVDAPGETDGPSSGAEAHAAAEAASSVTRMIELAGRMAPGSLPPMGRAVLEPGARPSPSVSCCQQATGIRQSMPVGTSPRTEPP